MQPTRRSWRGDCRPALDGSRVEPLPVDDFLSHLRRITADADVLLIFDEIISFRAARRQPELYGVRPDLTCLAKVIAGGTPAGAFGGRADIMALFDPHREWSVWRTDPTVRHLQRQPALDGRRHGHLAAVDPGSLRPPRHADPAVGGRIGRRLRRGGRPGAGDDGRFALPRPLLASAPAQLSRAAQDNGRMHRWLQLRLLNQEIMWSTAGNVSVPMGEGGD
ncbi:MAG: aminotransferase class III-fold pyridoxal phosphate-dependent enzyme [Caldilineaceae bacterium]